MHAIISAQILEREKHASAYLQRDIDQSGLESGHFQEYLDAKGVVPGPARAVALHANLVLSYGTFDAGTRESLVFLRLTATDDEAEDCNRLEISYSPGMNVWRYTRHTDARRLFSAFQFARLVSRLELPRQSQVIESWDEASQHQRRLIRCFKVQYLARDTAISLGRLPRIQASQQAV